jgi:hypothetical protein
MDDANWWVSEGYKLGDSRNVAVDFEGQCIGGAGLQFQQNENQSRNKSRWTRYTSFRSPLPAAL